jgi:hypothetical protein
MSDAERRERATLKRRGFGILETEKQAERRRCFRLRKRMREVVRAQGQI